MLIRRNAVVLTALWVIVFLGITTPLLQAQLIHVPTETPEQGKAFSEFNHRMAGVFLLAIGIVAAASKFSPRLSFLAKIWPFFFILPGLYLAIMSDPEVWPMGTQNWIEVFRSNPEARQHKVFSMLLLALGFFELQRSRAKLGKFLATWSFPALAIAGAVLLFFHPHTVDETTPKESAAVDPHAGHDMPGMKHDPPSNEQKHEGHVMTETMLKVQYQHLWFSLVGFAIALTKFVYDGGFWRKPFVPVLWPAFMSALGFLLIFYAE